MGIIYFDVLRQSVQQQQGINMSTLTISERLMDDHFGTVNDNDFLSAYNEVETHQSMLVVEFLQHHTATLIVDENGV